ncbi:MAG: hypothetical protein ACRET0_05130 [Steroidobacteraceae bacterium]
MARGSTAGMPPRWAVILKRRDQLITQAGNDLLAAHAKVCRWFELSAPEGDKLFRTFCHLARHHTLCRQLEFDALLENRPVAWMRRQTGTSVARRDSALILTLEAVEGGENVADRDFDAELKALPRKDRDRVRKRAARHDAANPFPRPGRPRLGCHDVVVDFATMIAIAIHSGPRAKRLRNRKDITAGQRRFLRRPIPFSLNNGHYSGPAWDLLDAGLRLALPINTTLLAGERLPKESLAEILKHLPLEVVKPRPPKKSAEKVPIH